MSRNPWLLPGRSALRTSTRSGPTRPARSSFHMVWVAHVELPRGLTFARYYLAFGVPLFFVVTAFSLAFGYMQRLRSLSDIAVFYIRRFARIAPLFYCMLTSATPRILYLSHDKVCVRSFRQPGRLLSISSRDTWMELFRLRGRLAWKWCFTSFSRSSLFLPVI